MRSFLTRSLEWAPVLVVPSIAYMVSVTAAMPETKISVQEYDINQAFSRFYLSGAPEDILTNALVVEVQVPPSKDVLSETLLVNGQTLDLGWDWRSPEATSKSHRVPSNLDTLPQFPAFVGHSAWKDYPLSISGYDGKSCDIVASVAVNALQDSASTTSEENVSEAFIFRIKSINQKSTDFGFSMLVHPRSSNRLRSIIPSTSGGRSGEFEQKILPHSFVVEPRLDRALRREAVDFDRFPLVDTSDVTPDVASLDAASTGRESFDIEAEIALLLALEEEAGELQSKVATQKQLIASRLQQHRANVSLKHLLQQCDGVLCAAKVIAQRLCDKVGISTTPSFKYVEVQSPLTQHLLGLKSDSAGHGANAASIHSSALDVDNLTSTRVDMHVDFSHPTDALIKVLEIIATALGLVSLCAWIHHKFMPIRTRVERDADREERRNARAYRRAARRAQFRARWNDLTRSLNCFRPRTSTPKSSPSTSSLLPRHVTRNSNYEEKRALILQDAFLEQDIDHAEKGEVMEAEIRELRHAHDIVSSLIRPGNGPPLPTPVADPPPPLVPLPFTPLTRSRASSGTLPSYTSEVLPDYSSRAYESDLASSSGILGDSSREGSSNGSLRAPSTSSDDGSDPSAESQDRSTAPSEVGSGRSRFTAFSSIPDISRSPRISEETLRTRQSKDTRYSREF